jgi:hypothetical protein
MMGAEQVMEWNDSIELVQDSNTWDYRLIIFIYFKEKCKLWKDLILNSVIQNAK